MIDFTNKKLLKLHPAKKEDAFESLLGPMLCDDEQILGAYKSVRDGVVFTNKRLITVDIQGMTGKTKEITSLPYRQIQAYSIETAGHFDLDSVLEVWIASLGKITLEFSPGTNVMGICKVISKYAL